MEQSENNDKISRILYLFYLLFLGVSAVILVRIVWIQVTYSLDPKIESYFRPSKKKKTLEPERGAILDCNGKLLALSTPMYQVYMDCTIRKEEFEANKDRKKAAECERDWLEKARELSAGLSAIYGDKSASAYYDLIVKGRKNGRRYVRIGDEISHDVLQKVKALPLFNEGGNKGGIIVEKKDTRQYPYGALARSAIGYVRNNADRPQSRKGVEGRYDAVLHGKEGIEWKRIADGKEFIHNYDSTYRKAQDGMDVRMTIDIDIQDLADRALRRQIYDNDKIESACLVVMEVKTGAIRAMVNLQRDSVSGYCGEVYNYAIARTGEPGSVFKATTLMTLLDDGKVRMSDEIPTNHGRLKGFPDDHYITDYERKTGEDKISVLHGLEISSNYVFRKLAMDHYGTSPSKMIDRLYQYKLGESFDFDLEGFANPSIPSPKSKYWSNTDLGSVAIGYSVAETPLHILTFYNAIANRGRMMKPYLVESIESNGAVKKKMGPSVLNGSICSKAAADSLAYGLRMVVEEGTGRTRLKGAKCAIAGKTGTARMVLDPKYSKKSRNPYQDEYGRRQFQGTFVGFFPAEEPQYTAICCIYSRLSRVAFYGGTRPAMAIRDLVDSMYALDCGNGEVINDKNPLPKWD